jgi:hypothetical protein
MDIASTLFPTVAAYRPSMDIKKRILLAVSSKTLG